MLAATALFGSYTDVGHRGARATPAAGELRPTRARPARTSSSSTPAVLVGLLLGAAVVFLFSGLAINAVGRAAGAVVFEVRRQFREIPGIMEGTGRPEYGKVVDIVTRDSLRELATPGLLAILAPIAVGFGLGVGPLAGFLAGAIGTGTLMAVFLANSGGAWDNAKKLVEDGAPRRQGLRRPTRPPIIGDTVGDPFKDTAGPAINPLIKVMNLVSLLIAGAVVTMSVGDGRRTTPLRIVIALVAAAIIVGRGLRLQAPRSVDHRRRPGAAPAAARTRPGTSAASPEPDRALRPTATRPGRRRPVTSARSASGSVPRCDALDAGRRLVGRLREALAAAGFTYDGVAELLGPDGARALCRATRPPPACAPRPAAARWRP